MNLWCNHPPNVNSMTPSQNQNFSLPKDTILYILNNCNSPKVFQKLQQTCKYFYQKNKVAIINEPVFYFKFSRRVELFYFKKNEKKKHLKTGVEKIYWLTNSLLVRSYMPSNYFPSLYRCNLKSLKLDNQTLSFEELFFLLNRKNIEMLDLHFCYIKYDDGLPVAIDTILAQCPKIIEVCYINGSDNFSIATMERMNSLKFISKFERFSFGIFEFENGKYEDARELLCKFVRKNVKPNEEDSSCVHIYLFDSYHYYRDEFETYFNQNLTSWKVSTKCCGSENYGRHPYLYD